MNTDMLNNCDACAFWVSRYQDGCGDCRRYPPTLLLDDETLRNAGRAKPPTVHALFKMTRFPVTLANTGCCGEFVEAE